MPSVPTLLLLLFLRYHGLLFVTLLSFVPLLSLLSFGYVCYDVITYDVIIIVLL